VQLLARVSAVAPPVYPCPCPLSDIRSLCAPSGIGSFERSFAILRRPPLRSQQTPATPVVVFFLFLLVCHLACSGRLRRHAVHDEHRRRRIDIYHRSLTCMQPRLLRAIAPTSCLGLTPSRADRYIIAHTVESTEGVSQNLSPR